MSYILVIVESPSKCKKIEQYLNKHPQTTYKCIASYGHIRELAGLEAIDIHHNFAPTFIECVPKKEQISKLRRAIKDASEVILASDDDREGEAIAWHLSQVFKLPIDTTKRIIFHEITEAALQQAIANPTIINMSLVNAQIARQVLDLLVGYKLSPLLWKHVKDGLSAGRCQTPALRLIYENEREINSSVGKQSYTITGSFTNANIPFVLNYEYLIEPEAEPKAKSKAKAKPEKESLQDFLQASLVHLHSYTGAKLQNKTRAAPEPFSTSSIQQHCSNELHLSPKETMAACQTLYEGGYITYHRTDSREYSEEFKEKAAAYIIKTWGEPRQLCKPHTPLLEESSHTWVKIGLQSGNTRLQSGNTRLQSGKTCPDTAGDGLAERAAAPHEAIRITNLLCKNIDQAITDKRLNRVYQLIWQRTLESCMADAVVSVLTASISAPYNREYHYTTSQVVFPGWKIVASSNSANDGENDGKNYAYLQTIKPGLQLPYQKIKANLHLKELKTHYSEARLVQLLEEKGIGRPSTFATLIEKIQERKYVKKENVKGRLISCTDYEINGKELIKIITEKEFGNEKNKLVIQPVGVLALEFLLKHFEPLFQYVYTKQMEEDLDSVAKDEKIWYEVCQECYKELEHLSSSILEKGKETIRIDANHTYIIGKYGPVIKMGGAPASSASPDPPSGESLSLDVEDIIVNTPAAPPALKRGSGGVFPLFKAVRSDIDLNKLRKGEYVLEDILEKKSDGPTSIGLYQEKPVYIKVGKFGKYLEWNNLSKSLKHLKQNPSNITLEDVSDILFDLSNEEDTSSMRIITEDASIRKGKYGYYIFYRNKKMKKPRFLKLDGFSGDYMNCDLNILQEWFKNTYKIDAI
jgi:DNA topoisomerase-1